MDEENLKTEGEQELPEKPELQAKKRHSAVGTVLYVLIMIVLITLIAGRWYLTSRFFVVKVDGSSMSNTLINGDYLLVKKTSDADRGDVIVISVSAYKTCSVCKKHPYVERNGEWVCEDEHCTGKSDVLQNGYTGDFLIKRLIAVSGDKVKCENGNLYLQKSGETEYTLLEEGYIKGTTGDFGEYVVGEDEIFFLGDNRTSIGSSIDSRYREQKDWAHIYQLYKKSDICGVVSSWAIEHKEFLEKLPSVQQAIRKD